MPYKGQDWDFNVDSWVIEITGMQMDGIALKIDVGDNPIIKVNLSLKRLLEEMSKDELKKLIEYSEKRLKCLI